MVDYNLLNIARIPSHSQTQFCNVEPSGSSVKFTNSNTNKNGFADIISENVMESIELGYNTQKSLYSLIKSPEYKKYKSYLESDSNTKKCSTYGDMYSDINGHHGFKPIMCGNRNECLIDASLYTAALSSDAFERLKAVSDKWKNNFGKYLYFFDDTFTLPANIQEKLLSMGSEGDKEFRRAISEYYRIFYGGLPDICLNHQDWSSKRPLDKPFIHVHAFGLNLFYKTESFVNDQPLGFFEVEPFIDHEKSLSVWLECVKRLCSRINVQLEHDILSGKKKLVQNHYFIEFNPFAYTVVNGVKKSNYNLIKHNINYDMRKPIIDIVKSFTKTYQQDLSGAQISRFKELTSSKDNKKQHVWIGWFADGVIKKYFALLQLHIKTKKELKEEYKTIDKPDTFICPICGEELNYDEKDDLVYLADCSPDTIIINESMRKGHLKLNRIVPIAPGPTISTYDEISIHDLNEMRF